LNNAVNNGEKMTVSIKKYKALTLIELLIVIAIISILALIAVPNFLFFQVRSKHACAIADLAITASAIENYYCDFTEYPPNTANFDNADNSRKLSSLPFLNSITLHRLTTPVAYLGSLSRDVFMDKCQVSEDFNEPFNSIIKNQRSFCYINYDDTPDGKISMHGRQISYLMWSLGPDKKNSCRFRDYDSIIDYDPTNGSISPGDIIVYGPVN
jgi:prepilin-type N-terminal cleavage/methylation domain-containing protein